MKTVLDGNDPLKRWQKNVYTCVDGLEVTCRRETVKLGKVSRRKLPINGIQSVDKNIFVAVSGAVLNRIMTEVTRGGPARTCTLPRTVTTVCEKAFKNTNIASVRLNEGLKTLKDNCFSYSGIRRLVLPASVVEVSEEAFDQCRHM